MTPTAWIPEDEPDAPTLTLVGWLRVLVKGSLLFVLIFVNLMLMFILRLVERPLFGVRRPWTPFITQFVCRNALRIIGLTYKTVGEPMRGPGAVVANHVSWLDIFVLNARKRIYFVSKEEVAGWPGIGTLAKATGTVFIKRDRKEAVDQIAVFRERLGAGHKLLFFPEGTSTDGQRVLPFKPTLFAAFLDEGLRETLSIQPVTLDYRGGTGMDTRQYGWWGDMEFGTHLLSVLSAPSHGEVTVTYHAPIEVRDYDNRKVLAKTLEDQVRSAMPEHARG